MKKKLLIGILVCLLLGAMGWRALTGYSRTLEANWGFSLPLQALCREVYARDTGPSFHGDGLRYHVFSYRYEDYIELMFAWAWSGAGRTTVFGKTGSQAAQEWLDALEVPQQWRPAYDSCYCWYKSSQDNSEILVLWDQEQNLLYITESFL